MHADKQAVRAFADVINTKLFAMLHLKSVQVPSAICEPNNSILSNLMKVIAHFFHSVVFNKMDGAAGPSGTDAARWKWLCSSFGTHSADLCDAITYLTRRSCKTYDIVDPKGLEASVACRLIALNTRAL
jgi:hypothetical protein